MNRKVLAIFIFTTLRCANSCKEPVSEKTENTTNQTVDFKQEKKAILETINNETKATFQRNYESWKEKRVHDPTITKTYINFVDSTFSESIGWNKISKFPCPRKQTRQRAPLLPLGIVYCSPLLF